MLQGYLQDRLNASLMKMPLTGNGRRESFAHMPMPRMTNTFMLAGEDDPQDIIRSVDKGLYAVAFGGGSVDITSGKFVFSASEAYLIEGGKIGRPVRDATLVGNGPDVMTRITRVGSDLALDDGVGDMRQRRAVGTGRRRAADGAHPTASPSAGRRPDGPARRREAAGGRRTGGGRARRRRRRRGERRARGRRPAR